MQSDFFFERIAHIESRVEKIHQGGMDTEIAGQNLLLETLEELQISLEELQVSNVELHQQNEELMAARYTIEVERQRYQDLFEFAPDAYLVTTPEGTLREVNQAATRLLNLPAHLLVGKPLITFVPEATRKEFRTFLLQLQQVSQPQKWLVSLNPRQRQPVTAEITVTMVHDPNSESPRMLWLLRDVTQQKQLEQQINQLNLELEQRVAERTAQLEAANRMKDEFLAVVSHEIRTPLNSILGWAQMLSRGNLPEATYNRAIETIERNARSQKHLIEDLLDMSRIIRGKLPLNLCVFDPVAAVETAISTMSPAAEEKNITVVSQLEQTVNPIRADPDRLQQIIWNLLSNAIKFTPPGGQVEVRLYQENTHLLIQVRDTGQGIEPELLPHVFDTFRQGEAGTNRSHKGLGLGLSIVRHLVELHQGTIQAQSAGRGQGATFTLRLPY